MSHHTRHDVIERLVTAALQGMTETAQAEQASNDEILSAYFTIVRRGIHAALSISVNPSVTRFALRQSLFTALADVADTKLN